MIHGRRRGRLWVSVGGASALLAFATGPTAAQPPRGLGRTGGAPAPPPAAEALAPSSVEPEPDVIHLNNGNHVYGYVEEATTERVVVLKEMRRGSFTRATLPRNSVLRIEYAPEPARAALQARVEWWLSKKQRDTAAMSAFSVDASSEIPGGWEASGPYVTIHSDVDAAFTREMAWRLNTMWEEWLDVFGRTHQPGAPTRMFVLAQKAELDAVLRRGGQSAQQAAMVAGLYVPAYDVGIVPIQSNESRAYQEWLLAQEESGRPWNYQALDREKRRIRSHIKTERAYAIATLYHETMHAFVHKDLLPGHAAVSVWLNEGMATYVEMLREDVEGLRTAVPNPIYYPRVRKHLSAGTLPGIRDLVARRESIDAHDTTTTAQAFYAAAWSLVYFLNVDRGTLGSARYARYVEALRRGTDPVRAFEAMTGEPLAETEAAWHRAIPTWD